MNIETRFGQFYRDYAAPSGLASNCQVLARYEARLAGGNHHHLDMCVAQSAGSAQAIATTMAVLLQNIAQNTVLMVGQCYPIFYHQAQLHRCVVIQSDGVDYNLPPIEQLLEDIHRHRPTVIILAIPANPSGDCYPVEYLDWILRAAQTVGAHILIDRVGMLFGDQRLAQRVCSALAPWISDGRAIMIDSLSKSESLAGYRLAHVVGNRNFVQRYAREQQNTIMNPPTVLALSIPMIYFARTFAFDERIDALQDDIRKAERALSRFLAMLDLDERDTLISKLDSDFIANFVTSYTDHHVKKTQSMAKNKNYAIEVLGEEVSCVSSHKAGMNFVVEIERFRGMDEEYLQRDLAFNHGVFILTERCFSVSNRVQSRKNFLVRLSVAMEGRTFCEGIDRLANYIARI